MLLACDNFMFVLMMIMCSRR